MGGETALKKKIENRSHLLKVKAKLKCLEPLIPMEKCESSFGHKEDLIQTLDPKQHTKIIGSQDLLPRDCGRSQIDLNQMGTSPTQ